ncbi:MAG: selenocysteine-specific translation elongation factor [Deltaproteobacteria bacterium]|nr:selenocysteine-specific translation elongation factor [Deltaproteobacteria bacterium]MBK8714626.1 selenocysteine-specific translation elongation factor [Deltaproteobacteria bacterium]
MSKSPHAIVVGTAGHIDHGKTTLVRALTGIDTDRLPEEKRRGITIELGFAAWPIAPDLEASIVDVPGHEGFVRTMVAGAGGIDLVVLVVSAEDGVMPQTREHINVCRLLGVAAGVVALTKIDRLGDDPEALELATDDVRGALAGTPFAEAPIVPCSAVTGVGIEQLRDTVRRIAAKLPRRDNGGAVILGVDRVFTIKGHGTVVTGTLLSGSVDVRGDESLVLVPHGPDREPFAVRARAAQVRGDTRDRVLAGCRLALNLAGVERTAVERGDVVTRGPEVARQSFVHAKLLHLPGHSPTWTHGTTLQICAGTAHGVGVLDPLWVVPSAGATGEASSSDGVEVPPGAEAIVRIRLEAPLPLWRGQRLVVRAFAEPHDDWSGRTVGGGVVLDPEPSEGRGQRPRWIALARALDHADAEVRRNALLHDAGLAGIDTDALSRRAGGDARAQLQRQIARGELLELQGGRFVLEAGLRPVVERCIALVDRFHAANPLQAGMARAALEGALEGRLAADVRALAVDRAIARGGLRVVDDFGTVARPGKGLQPGGELPGHMKSILARYLEGGLTPPTLREVGDAVARPPRDVLEMVTSLQRMGKLVRITADLSLARESHDELCSRVRTHLREHGTIDVQALKQLAGLSRKFAVPMLEHLDELQITLRQGDARIPGPKL